MAKSSRRPSSIKALTIIRSRDIVANKLLKPCEEDNHSKCTGWAMLKKELSPINANYFLRCTCSCHKNQKKAVSLAPKMKKVKQKHLRIKNKKRKKSNKTTRKGQKRK